MALQLLAEEDMSLMRLIGRLLYERDPLPGQGDLNVRDRLLNMEGASARVYERRSGVGPAGEVRPPWTDVFTITELGRAVLKGDVDFMSLNRPTVGWAAFKSEWGWTTGVGMNRPRTPCTARQTRR